ncbi:MAG: hypothetical protein Q9190_004300 [Brigantiaea leucoxantha]
MDSSDPAIKSPADTLAKQPISATQLDDIATAACDSTFQFVDGYQHSRTESWNGNIISTVLKSLISETSTSSQPPQYKFAVTSTIIQHTALPPSQPANYQSSSTGGPDDDPPSNGVSGSTKSIGRRGMHSATGAYWNNDKDGTWSWKYAKAEEKGFDVIVSVMWISIV